MAPTSYFAWSVWMLHQSSKTFAYQTRHHSPNKQSLSVGQCRTTLQWIMPDIHGVQVKLVDRLSASDATLVPGTLLAFQRLVASVQINNLTECLLRLKVSKIGSRTLLVCCCQITEHATTEETVNIWIIDTSTIFMCYGFWLISLF